MGRHGRGKLTATEKGSVGKAGADNLSFPVRRLPEELFEGGEQGRQVFLVGTPSTHRHHPVALVVLRLKLKQGSLDGMRNLLDWTGKNTEVETQGPPQIGGSRGFNRQTGNEGKRPGETMLQPRRGENRGRGV